MSGSKKGHVSGGKVVSSHGTVIDLVQEIVNFLSGVSTVTKIIPSVITPIRGRQSSLRVVKIYNKRTVIVVTVTQKVAIQELRFYSINADSDTLTLARWVRDNGYELRFQKAEKV